jgi:hypothetical protein
MRMMRTRQSELAVALAAALCAAGCGSGAQRHVFAPQPTLPRPVAEALAQRSDTVAEALDAGESCLALALARDLQQQSIAAVNAGHVAASLQEPLQGAVNQLAARIQCVTRPRGEGNGNGRHKGKDKHGEGND